MVKAIILDESFYSGNIFGDRVLQSVYIIKNNNKLTN